MTGLPIGSMSFALSLLLFTPQPQRYYTNSLN